MDISPVVDVLDVLGILSVLVCESLPLLGSSWVDISPMRGCVGSISVLVLGG